MDDDGWQLLPKPAKRLKKLTCFDKCIFCQTGVERNTYTKQKLKARLVAHYKEDLVFHQPPQQSKPEIVYSSSTSLVDIVNAAIYQLSATRHDKLYVQGKNECIHVRVLRHLRCRNSKLPPQNLYWLLRWIITGEHYSDRSSSSNARIPADERKIIMAAQAKLPKYEALAMSVKHITGSKQLVILLNRMGHCSSYVEIEQVETSLVNESLARSKTSGVIIPTNINPGVFIQMAADNNDINEETLDGKKTTHATTMAIYSASSTSYNRGIRAHTLTMEVIFRLLWQVFVEWLEREKVGLKNGTKQLILGRSKECRNTVKQEDFFAVNWSAFQGCIESLMLLLDTLKLESRKKSKVFNCWEDYINMVLLLLQFLEAERTGNWKLHLSATAAMVPHFFSMDRVNYALWLPVYLSDMNMLESHHPEVCQKFMAGSHSVSRSKQPFARVWPDMALEQSINLDSKSHERAAITQKLKTMCGIQNCDRIGTHKEASATRVTRVTRVTRDENDVQKLLATFNGKLLSDPFHNPDDIINNEAPLTLSNLATGIVLPDAEAKRLLDAAELGKQSMEGFVSSRVQSKEINFLDPIHKLKIKSFSSVAKLVIASFSVAFS
ncbi:Hypothetical predicted protein [Paramuricea clavata]|uniref:Uncharacterized protein n=1 Tax=Paramuricea clavata TaxID=317549 RepID=A0A7D9JRK3_PARCT|nr:Hypothetical predicted protein [Paramuricea clavata]